MLNKEDIIELNNGLDGFVTMFTKYSPEEQWEFICLNPFLSILYRKGMVDGIKEYKKYK